MNTESEQEDFTIESNPADIPLTIDQDLQKWIHSIEGVEDIGYQATLYKYDNAKHGNRKEFCHTYDDWAPSLHEIGEEYGGGRYMMIVSLPEKVKGKRMVKNYRFRIHHSYDKDVVDTLPAVQHQNQSVSMQENVNVIRDIIKMLAPLMKPNEPQQFQDPKRMTEMMNDVISSSAKSQIGTVKELITSMKDTQLSLGVEQEPEEDGVSKMIQMVAPLMEQYLPLLLGSGAQATAVASVVKAMPAVKKIIKNKKDLAELIEHTLEHRGKADTVKLLKKLNIKATQVPAKYKPLLGITKKKK